MKIQQYLLLAILSFISACHPKEEPNLNTTASVIDLGDLTENPLLANVITSIIHPNDGTMQTLYGNNIAWQHQNNHTDLLYPNGAVLYLVTWKQEADALWFGANIPHAIRTIEQVRFTEKQLPKYEVYHGENFKKDTTPNPKRLATILKLKMAVSP